MQFITRQESISVQKPDGTAVDYYIFPEYEIHYNTIEPGTHQQWHHHEVIEETLYIIDGDLEAHWREDGVNRVRDIGPGDVVRVEKTPHTFVNSSTSPVRYKVFLLRAPRTSQPPLSVCR